MTNHLPPPNRWRAFLPQLVPGILVFAYFAVSRWDRSLLDGLAAGAGAAIAVTVAGLLGMVVCIYAVARIQGREEDHEHRYVDHPHIWAATLLFAVGWIWVDISRRESERQLLACVESARYTEPDELRNEVSACIEASADTFDDY